MDDDDDDDNRLAAAARKMPCNWYRKHVDGSKSFRVGTNVTPAAAAAAAQSSRRSGRFGPYERGAPHPPRPKRAPIFPGNARPHYAYVRTTVISNHRLFIILPRLPSPPPPHSPPSPPSYRESS